MQINCCLSFQVKLLTVNRQYNALAHAQNNRPLTLLQIQKLVFINIGNLFIEFCSTYSKSWHLPPPPKTPKSGCWNWQQECLCFTKQFRFPAAVSMKINSIYQRGDKLRPLTEFQPKTGVGSRAPVRRRYFELAPRPARGVIFSPTETCGNLGTRAVIGLNSFVPLKSPDKTGIGEKQQNGVGVFIQRGTFYPLLPSGWYKARLAKTFISIILDEIIKEISYERWDYESVDKKSLS